ncbi:formylglycine-generating enzyme family protein [Paenibacillus hunanensis]|uniref:Formylglycine-generating enzyme required for sulfatase activity n=1 Tax=Paenibacillus hunanensis TaxID=539262 RepID=A0ABU1IX51_9BACL|nr:SUMF1/EgtB/PvdO family nonheme iron enzyme [Paenibacillus hunanensis]MDR6243839.1 formylglycine-generating enzyme required for sulfatase activity [Paenibacillus hunanensis]GGJ25250.1 hypothetical protein GCM10008022_37690 [Paenibacillus hunanensis]
MKLISLEDHKGNLNSLSDREAMGLPNEYVRLSYENIHEEFDKIRNSNINELLNICENPEYTFGERLSAATVLGFIGDPRINVLEPKMIKISKAIVNIGTKHDEVDDIIASYKDTGIIKDWISKETPNFEVELDEYYISKYLVTNLEYLQFLKECPNAEIPSSWIFGRFPTEKSNHPVFSISSDSADEYCAWLSKKTGRTFRLPTEYEWEYAAAGPEKTEFPWGNQFNNQYLNTVEFGLLASTPVGIFPQGKSYFGILDMAGNVEEYVADDYVSYPNGEEIKDDLVNMVQNYRIARGGSFSRLRDLARCQRRHGRYPREIYVMGFRLAESKSI